VDRPSRPEVWKQALDKLSVSWATPHIKIFPQFYSLLGGPHETIFFCYLFGQIEQLQSSGVDVPWICKTTEEIKAGTGLTRSQQERVRRNLRERKVLIEEARGMPARLHFRLDEIQIRELIGDR